MDGGGPAKAYEDKTEIILIGTQQELDKVSIAHLEIGQASVLIVIVPSATLVCGLTLTLR